MFITVNGEQHEVTRPLTVGELLDSLTINPSRVAILHNLEIMRRRDLAEKTVREGDRIDLVNLVHGD
jgi:thiamine biosynthesis protein ThiS